MKKKLFNIVWILLILIFSVSLLYSVFKIYSYRKEQTESSDYNNILREKSIQYITDTQDNQKNTDSISNEENLKHAPITVDFNTLNEENKDIKAWIYCENTPINYPIAQSEDNDKYLRHLLNGNYNISGTIFMDYRCAPDFSDLNTIIYGHNMKNDTMFGTFVNYENQEYYEAHPILYLLTAECDYEIELIYGGYVSSSSNIYGSIPKNHEERESLIREIKENSTFVSENLLSENERSVALSTCSSEDNNMRYVLIGKLIELKK